MVPVSEIAQAVQEQRESIGRLEGELRPRRRLEAQALVDLEAKLATLEQRQGSAEARLLTEETHRDALAAELTRLEDGLGRARRAWVRVLAPTAVSMLLLVALMSIGLSGGRSSWLVLLLTGFGFALGKRGGRGRE